MTVAQGTYELTAENGSLRLYTTKQGLAGMIGHNLTLEVADWSATVQIETGLTGSTLEMRADLGTLTVVEGSGGARPLTEKDIRDILANAAKSLRTAAHPELRYTAALTDDGALTGELTLAGHGAQQQLALDEPEPGSLRVFGVITQSRFGIKPFSAALGTLRISDDVRVDVTVEF